MTNQEGLPDLPSTITNPDLSRSQHLVRVGATAACAGEVALGLVALWSIFTSSIEGAAGGVLVGAMAALGAVAVVLFWRWRSSSMTVSIDNNGMNPYQLAAREGFTHDSVESWRLIEGMRGDTIEAKRVLRAAGMDASSCKSTTLAAARLTWTSATRHLEVVEAERKAASVFGMGPAAEQLRARHAHRAGHLLAETASASEQLRRLVDAGLETCAVAELGRQVPDDVGLPTTHELVASAAVDEAIDDLQGRRDAWRDLLDAAERLQLIAEPYPAKRS